MREGAGTRELERIAARRSELDTLAEGLAKQLQEVRAEREELVIAFTDGRGRLLWISAARPERTSEITACRHGKLTQKRRKAGLGAIDGLGFVGLDDAGPDADPAVITGYKATRNWSLTCGQELSNKALAAVRIPVEHGFAHLKNWRVLGKVRTDPRWATALVRALLC